MAGASSLSPDSRMKRIPTLLVAASLSFFAAHAEDLQPTLMTTRGKLLVDQNFAQQPPPFDGKSHGFASGFKGWRFNTEKRGGHWEAIDGAFRGSEFTDPVIKHPATASYGFDFKDVVIQCEVRMLDVPLEGRAGRRIQVRTTDTNDYVCSVMVNPDGMKIEKSDNDHAGPDKPVPLGELKSPIKLGEWQKVVFEILGDEMVGTLNGQSLTGRHPLIAEDKHSIMFVSGCVSEVRNFKVWQALPNPEWAKNKAAMKAVAK